VAYSNNDRVKTVCSSDRGAWQNCKFIPMPAGVSASKLLPVSLNTTAKLWFGLSKGLVTDRRQVYMQHMNATKTTALNSAYDCISLTQGRWHISPELFQNRLIPKNKLSSVVVVVLLLQDGYCPPTAPRHWIISWYATDN